MIGVKTTEEKGNTVGLTLKRIKRSELIPDTRKGLVYLREPIGLVELKNLFKDQW